MKTILSSAFVLMAGLAVAEDARIPDSVRTAYEAAEPQGILRELQLCGGPDGAVYRVNNATGYEEHSVFFDTNGQEIGWFTQPDTGPVSGNFEPATLTGCAVLMTREM